MAYSFLTPDNLSKTYTESRRYTNLLTEPFPEFQRIARNRPHHGIDPAYPKTTDGTTASIVQKTPKRIVQQLPTGVVETEEADDWLPVVAQFIYTNKIIPYANEDYGLFEKSQLIIENGLTFGFGASYAPFLNHDGYFCPDMTLPYWGDIFLQKGKKSGYSCSYVFYRVWWQKSDIKALLASERKLAAAAKKRNDKYDATWDTVALKTVLDSITKKDEQARTPTDKERNTNPEGIELVTAFQKGVGAKFYTFCPSTNTKGESDVTIVRTKINKDPRGKIPIDWFYGDIDGNNPLGRGVVELIGGLQNLIDSDMQMYQYNRALMLAPPVIKKGNIGDFKFAPNVVIDASNDPNASIEPLTIDTSAVVNYPSLYGLQKSQLLNLVNSPDTSISSDVGNPSFSKTTAGVQQQQATISVDDNAIRKRFETWFGSWSETAINLYFAERSGKEELQLDQETASRLRELPNFDESLLSEDDKIMIDYDSDTPILKFKVNPSTTAVADKAAQVADATSLLDLVMQYPMLNSSYGGPIDTDVLARRIVTNSGIDDPEKVAPEPTPAQIESKKEQQNQISPFSPMFDKPTIQMHYSDVPAVAQLDFLRNAGSTNVTLQDVMGGPVADPNVRGVMNPLDDPSVLLPGQQPGQPAVQSAPTQAPGALPQSQPPIQQPPAQITPDHILKAQQQDHQQTMDKAKLALEVQKTMAQTIPPGSPQPVANNQPTVQQPQQQIDPEEAQIIEQLRRLGLSDNAIAQVLQMMKQGASEQQVLQQLGIKIGVPNA